MLGMIFKIFKTGNHNDEQAKQTDATFYDFNSPAITATMTIAGNIVNRLASNSNTCKAISAAIAGAIIGLKESTNWIYFTAGVIVILVLAFYDSMYISLKKGVENNCQHIRNDIKKGKPVEPFYLKKVEHLGCSTVKNLASRSVGIFYLIIIAALALATFSGSQQPLTTPQ